MLSLKVIIKFYVIFLLYYIDYIDFRIPLGIEVMHE